MCSGVMGWRILVSMEKKTASRTTAAASRMPMGTLMNSPQRHDSHEVSMPPAIRPMAPPDTATAENTPKARLRSPPSAKLVVIRDRAVGAAMAAPTPWRARAASSQPDDVARPPTNEAKVNTRMPATNTRRRPRMSPARAPRRPRRLGPRRLQDGHGGPCPSRLGYDCVYNAGDATPATL